jgi:hypothetical protein
MASLANDAHRSGCLYSIDPAAKSCRRYRQFFAVSAAARKISRPLQQTGDKTVDLREVAMAMPKTILSTMSVRPVAMDVAGVLLALSEELTANHFTAAGLATLEFNPDDTIKVVTLEQPRLAGYPTLDAILDEIAVACWADGITMSQLRRLEFSDDAIWLELDADRTGTRPRHRFPIDVFATDD